MKREHIALGSPSAQGKENWEKEKGRGHVSLLLGV